jgi:hypothetical protein
MSLKGFHIVFITFSTLLAVVCGAWCLRVSSDTGATGYVIGAVVCFCAAVGLVVYGVWFWKKMKRLRIII